MVSVILEPTKVGSFFKSIFPCKKFDFYNFFYTLVLNFGLVAQLVRAGPS